MEQKRMNQILKLAISRLTSELKEKDEILRLNEIGELR